jgi:hypothetical protein
MRTTRTIMASLATILAAAAVAGPAAAIPADTIHHQPDPWYAGESTIQGSLRSEDSHAPPTSTGFDWGSGGIGAAAGIGAFAIALAGAAGMRRRRVKRAPSVPTH